MENHAFAKGFKSLEFETGQVYEVVFYDKRRRIFVKGLKLQGCEEHRDDGNIQWQDFWKHMRVSY